MAKYRGSGRGIIGDNFFTSFSLACDLLQQKMTYCGTIRTNRKEIPPAMKNLHLLPRPNAFLFHTGTKMTLLRHMYRRSKFVLLLSSAHYDESTVDIETHGGTKTIPTIVDYYNCNKGGVDTADYKISSYTSQVPSYRWPFRVRTNQTLELDESYNFFAVSRFSCIVWTALG